MSALFKAEIDNLQRLVQTYTAESAAPRRESAIGTQGRRKAVERMVRISRDNRAVILSHVLNLREPASALKIAEHTGISDETCRRALIKLAEEGKIGVTIPNPNSSWKRYGPL
jgi:hypothetical protein